MIAAGALAPACSHRAQRRAAAQNAGAEPAAARAASAPSVPEEPPPQQVAYHPYDQKTGNPYTDRFIALWNDIHNPDNGYLSREGVPYHAVETLLC